VIQVQAQSIKGQLVDTEQNVLPFATVALYLSSDSSLIDGAITTDLGAFSFEKLKQAEYFLLIQFMGYEPAALSAIRIGKNDVKDLGKITMKPSTMLLEEVQVSGEKLSVINKVDRQVFDATSLQSATGSTATDVLRNMPSVSVDAQGVISVRGSTGFVVLLNGKPIQTDPATILNQFPANAIENIEIMTAPSAKYDPEGKGGLINIVTKKGAGDGLFLQTNIRYGLPSIEPYDNAENALRYGADFSLNYRKKKWDVSFGMSYLRNDISGRRVGEVTTTIGDTLTSFPSDGERSFDEENYSGRFTVGYTPSKSDNFSIGFFAGKRTKDRTADILYFNNTSTQISTGNQLSSFEYFNENLRVRRGDFVLGSFDYAHSFENKSKISTSLLYEYTLLGGPTTNLNLDPETREIYQEEFNTNDNPLNGLRFQVDYLWKPLKVGQFESGYQFRNLDHTGDFIYERKNNATGLFELVPAFSSEVDLKRSIHSAYTTFEGSKDKWKYSLGIRGELMNRSLFLADRIGTIDTTYNYDFFQLFPSASFQYSLKENVKLKAAYSRRVERTTTFKINPFPEREHSETLEQGDPELLPEFIDLLEVGIEKEYESASVFATAYSRHVQNLINRVNTVFNDTILNRIYSNVGTGLSLGFELGAELNPTQWFKAFVG
ncbi:MAG: TonB-dependent receptor, partial [Bacteroidota bacterium]